MVSRTPLTMTEALLTLTDYWAHHGCLISQPMNTEVGAGTLNPSTALRVLGPEPWRVAYVEPSVRPDDSRYGENPNRLQTHTQFQVILKPEPGDAQELYLGSLAALGIDTTAHDVRFVEDNWASPALGAWGLGWEVWLDGLEITQFTYFQQAGGLSLDPVSVEITYGIERICMALQKVDHFSKIAYAPGITYGEAFGQAEYEMSRYYLDDADIATQWTLFENYEAEAQRMIDARLPVPAHSYVLKCSHAFNVLDSRGAISTTERARAFARMRNLAHNVAQLWVARREELEFPLGSPTSPQPHPIQESGQFPATPAMYLLEIGTEEMPPHEAQKAATNLQATISEKLQETRLEYGDLQVHATPRRLIVTIADVAPSESDTQATVKGPRVSAAYDAEGNPTKALAGFARSQNIDLATLERLEVNGVEHVGLTKTVVGRKASDVLAEISATTIEGLHSDKNMRWNTPGLSFTRAIRWIVALLGETAVPFTVSSLVAGRITRVHRTASEPEIRVSQATDYLQFLQAHGIITDAAMRRKSIVNEAQYLAASVGGHIDIDGQQSLLEEITFLVEEPHAVLGNFNQDYLRLPIEVLTTVMRKHQRYLPIVDSAGNLLPHFVAIANGKHHDDEVVRAGNESVLRARYEDAAFFYKADLTQHPEDFKPHLDRLTFADKLGSMGDRARRINAIAHALARNVELSAEEQNTLDRAGSLAKFDLATQMVTELTSLAGIMARDYANHAGESQAVAQALYEMELPRTASDSTPQTIPGALLALADRLDLLTGLFATGATPRGSSDPFGMRRAALGVIMILRSVPNLSNLRIATCLQLAAEQQNVSVDQTTLTTAEEFVAGRLERQLLDSGVSHAYVAAVKPLFNSPAHVDSAVRELTELSSQDMFGELSAALQRVSRIVPKGTAASYDSEALPEQADRELASTFEGLRTQSDTQESLTAFAESASGLVKPINSFFDDVLVMADDSAVREARLGLLASISAWSQARLDWTAL